MFWLPTTAYFDDFTHLEPEVVSAGGRLAMEGLFALLGWEVATGAKKAPPFCSVFTALGVRVDVSQAHLGTIQVTNTPERLEALRAEVQSVVASGKLTSGEAASLRGRFQFAASQTFGRFGIVPLKLLAGRADSSNGGCLLDAALRQALEALMCHVVSGPPRCIRIKDARRPVVVFTDGAAEEGWSPVGQSPTLRSGTPPGFSR